MNKQAVFDANPIVDYLEGGPAGVKVNELLRQALREQSLVLVSVANWGEVFYTLWVRLGEEKARTTLANLLRLPIQLVPVDLDQALKAGEIKALHHLPYVDCLAAALTELHDAVLVTSDRHFERLGRRIRVQWIGRR